MQELRENNLASKDKKHNGPQMKLMKKGMNFTFMDIHGVTSFDNA